MSEQFTVDEQQKTRWTAREFFPCTVYSCALVWVKGGQIHTGMVTERVSGRTPLTREEFAARAKKAYEAKWPVDHSGPLYGWTFVTSNTGMLEFFSE